MLCPDLGPLGKGEVGEAYVLYKLLRWGEEVLQVSQNNPYDLLVLRDKPIKIQVKASTKDRYCSVLFNVRRGLNDKRYEKHDYDILALMALEYEKVVFMPLTKLRQVSVNKDDFNSANEYSSWIAALSNI